MTVLEFVKLHNFGDVDKKYVFEDGTSADLINLEKLKKMTVLRYEHNVEDNSMKIILRKENILYLEKVLDTLDKKANVIVYLSTSAKYGTITMRDCCGNHYAVNWLSALRYGNLGRKFVVDEFYSKFKCNEIQYYVTLKNAKCSETTLLDKLSNESASKFAFNEEV